MPPDARGACHGFCWPRGLWRKAARGSLLHGWNSHQSDGVDVRSALELAGIARAESATQAADLLDRDGIVYLPLECFAPRELELLRLREVFGLRSCINTVCRMLNPAQAAAAVQGVFHPPYRSLQQAASEILGQQNLCILKGGGGEFERNPGKDAQVFRLESGAPLETLLPPLLPEARKLADASYPPHALGALWNGTLHDQFAESIATGTATAALIALGHAPQAAHALANELWARRLIHPQATARSLIS